MRQLSGRNKTGMLGLLCTVIVAALAAAFTNQHHFRYSFSTDAGSDAGEAPPSYRELEEEFYMLKKYSMKPCEFVPLAAKSSVLDYESDAADLLKILDGKNSVQQEMVPPVYTDNVFSVTAQEPGYTKMKFCFQASTNCTFRSVTLQFRFDDKKAFESSVTIEYIIPFVQYLCVTDMPANAKKVKLVNIEFNQQDFEYGSMMELNKNGKEILSRVGNNTIYFRNRKSSTALILDKYVRVTDCVVLGSNGYFVAGYGAKYFYLIESG